ncbi:MAG TPA: DMT family transporter, partial [Euryarchaeota archaeon]|nr:DMT family transporter [Euryarchaeota archaeon]
MGDRVKSYAYALLAVALWSTVATAFKLSLREMDFVQLLFIATAVSTVVLFGVLAFQKKVHLLKEQSRADLGRSALFGFLNPCLYYLVLLKAYSLLPAQEAQALNYTWAITLTIFAIIFLKQKASWRSGVAIIGGFIGVLIISTRGDVFSLQFTDPLGDALAVGSSLIWAAYWVLNMKDKRDPVLKLFTGFLFGCVYVTIALLVLSEPVFPSPFGMGAAVYVGAFEMGLAFVFFLKALSLSDNSSRVGSLIYLSPFLSMVFIRFILDEP